MPSHRAGFTLIELLIYIGVTSLIVVSLIFFALSVGAVADKQRAIIEITGNSRFIIELLTLQIRQASVITKPLPGETSATLELTPPPPLAPLIFTLAAGEILTVEESGQPLTPLTASQVKVEQLSFTNLARSGERDSVRLDLILAYRSPSAPALAYRQSWSATVSARY